MLEIWMGRANTGKSARVLRQIRERKEPAVLLVPEHATHTAEIDLCRVCGPEASQYAEVMSIQSLARRALALTGGLSDSVLDAGGKLLLMQLSLQEVMSQLTVYAKPSRKAPFLTELVALCDELTACQVLPEDLGEAVPLLDGMSGEKVRDLSLIYAAYLGHLKQDGEDRRDLLEKLLEKLEDSGCANGKAVYLDGFTYFTAQELKLISILLRISKSVTVVLLGDESGLEIFDQTVRTRDRLTRLAGNCGVPCRAEVMQAEKPKNALAHAANYFFGSGTRWDGDCSGVSIYRADSVFHETEYVAAKILELVRTGKYRFRDIGVAARNLEEYEATIENVFERYGVPVYLSRRSDILEKPVLSLLAGALDAVAGGYEYEDMFRWLKTGLAGLSDEECDRLENYVILWDIHGAMWVRDEDWTANPSGWREGFTDAETQALAEINALRRRVGGPLGRLAEGLKKQENTAGKLAVLWAFLEELELAKQLEERTARLEELGELQRAMEYGQLWELLCAVMDQFADILRDTPLDTEEFGRLLKLVLTQYDVGTIPVSLDQVQVSQITRNDRSRVKCLFLMGANDHVLPAVQSSTGLLTKEDREQLLDHGIELAPSGIDLFHMELQNLYAALAQPSERLTVTWPAADLSGSPLRPSFVIGRIKALLPGVSEEAETENLSYRLTAPIPALELAGRERKGPLWQYFAEDSRWSSALAAMDRAARMNRGRLSPQAVAALYGHSYRMSASRIDKVNSCHFAYFMQYGLQAKERVPAGFDAAQVGTFLHYVLEHVTKEAAERGGFAKLEPGELEKLLDKVVRQYMDVAMPGFEKRDARFKYLFRRLRKTVEVIVENVADELIESDFVPVEFELGFGDSGKLPAISIHTADADLTVTGKVDRVDGWLKDGRLYLRVVDYKSGKKSFDLSDVCRGLNIQMLLYLFALEREGQLIFDQRIIPAGVLYLPARDVLVNQPRDVEPAALRRALDKELRRSGMVLNEPEVLQAMEHSALEKPRFLPLALNRDGSIAKGVATAAELGKLGRYVDKLLERIAKELHDGIIDADPCGYSEQDNACTYCEFASACNFMDSDERDHLELIRAVTPAEFWEHVNKTIGEEERS
ncbi:MAG: PD-(D/E)XK nuclease family protein [Oscillospiraceae bacterium]|nr:PD-(D/E)XK nuclease family protein [Oscillospiraceae bacterium]